MDGLLLVDKPVGPTSFDVVAEVRRRLGVRRVGHGGTLDPLATGLLPILVGEATKLVPYLIGLEKVYEATVRLGVATDTYDAEGRVTAEAAPSLVEAISEDAVRAALATFVGVIRQRPPAYSAIKRDGRRLYELARSAKEGEEVVADEREVVVYSVTFGRFAPPEVDFEVRCGKGTYIRSIAHDLGALLGVGGHLTRLRRTRIGGFDVAQAVDVFAAAAILLQPLGAAVDHLPGVAIDAAVEARIRKGQQEVLQTLALPGLCHAVRLLGESGRLIAIVEAEGGRFVIGRVFAAG
ncbi:MAG: tRNA pseudouridine(55) synthase TruB [Myxococcales bacterium]|nr:tRNA pseudouridine(55) synthase TruB [Myxococcales bacterium]